jgi:hypothetical protein
MTGINWPLLYNSLRTKIMTLPDATIVYPAHALVVLAGKIWVRKPFLYWKSEGNEYALRANMTEANLLKVTDGLLPPPAYFGMAR